MSNILVTGRADVKRFMFTPNSLNYEGRKNQPKVEVVIRRIFKLAQQN